MQDYTKPALWALAAVAGTMAAGYAIGQARHSLKAVNTEAADIADNAMKAGFGSVADDLRKQRKNKK